MTFTPVTNNAVSVNNVTSTPLGIAGEYLGTSEDVSRHASLELTLIADTDSAPTGVSLEFSPDGTNWDLADSFTYLSEVSTVNKSFRIKSRYFRVRFTNGAVAQTYFRLQVQLTTNRDQHVEAKIQPELVDSFNRIKISEPRTILSVSSILGKNDMLVHETLTGASTSTHNSDASLIELATTGTGTVLRRSRSRGIYQPGKSLLVYMTGVLDSGTNAATVTSKIGYYDDDGGYYFQFNDGTLSIVERTTVTGSLVETTVDQADWNVAKLDGSDGYELDPTKAIIFWFTFEWLGVGMVKMGAIINEELITLHRFRHSNLLGTPYIQTGSLPPTYELVSTGGAGSMAQICFSVISEGGHNPTGNVFSVNMGTTTKSISNTDPLISIRMKSGSKAMAVVNMVNVMSTSAANTLVELYLFNDIAASTVLTGESFVSANANSEVEYDVSATAINLSGGTRINSGYFANNSDLFTIASNSTNGVVNNNNVDVSDLYVVVIESAGPAENYLGSITWTELI